MPHTPQTAVVRLLQSVTDARNIVPGDRVDVRPHLIVMGPRDGLAALKAYLLAGGEEIKHPEHVVLFTDDNLPAPDAATAAKRKQLREAAAQAGIKRLIPAAGCEVAQVLEQALIVPGELAVSGLPEIHRLGGIGALGLRVTTRDLAGLLAGRALPLAVPQAVRVDLTGQRQALVSGRDVFFTLRREISRDRLVGRALEVGGLGGFTLGERMELATQASHAGLFGLFCLPDREGVAELNKRIARPYTTLEPEKDAAYTHTAQLDLGHAQLTVVPVSADAWRTAGEMSGEPVRRVVIGGQASCGIDAVRQAVEIIKLRRLSPAIECHLIPDTREVYRAAAREDLLGQLIDAGVRVHAPGTPPERLAGDGALLTTLTAPTGCPRAGVTVAATAACAGAIIHPERLDAGPQRDSKLSGRRPKAT
jgi:3-isopropylmalate/(R)-2-methylmalate dehydratase large subunit